MGNIWINTPSVDLDIAASDDDLTALVGKLEDAFDRGTGMWINVALEDSGNRGVVWVGPSAGIRVEFDGEPPHHLYPVPA